MKKEKVINLNQFQKKKKEILEIFEMKKKIIMLFIRQKKVEEVMIHLVTYAIEDGVVIKVDEQYYQL
ncbi:MAG: hypothetical protein EZS28_022319 [Streblomastix strix]|uniref:Uncharacterized protein n=1 Tax=Streblomastix strix TaxID=222440 RepID=A0A5J4VID8_9EUKA|nr:MAG: hypothetical protein EZS28_022319 [Streblomastix strix]